MNIDLTGKNALITGGTRGIGRAISRTLARCGARVGAIYRNDVEAADRTLQELRAHGDGHFALRADIAVEEEAIAAVQEAGKIFGGVVDFLILDAAAGAGGPLIGMKTEDDGFGPWSASHGDILATDWQISTT